MFIATLVAVVLALVLVVSAIGKLRRDPMQMKTLETVGFPVGRAGLLAGVETAGAIGLAVGLF